MSRNEIAVNVIGVTGLTDPSPTTPTDNIKFLNDGRTFVRLMNNDSGSHNATLVTQETVFGLGITAPIISVGAGITKFVGPFPAQLYNVASGSDAGEVYIDLASPAEWSVTVFRV